MGRQPDESWAARQLVMQKTVAISRALGLADVATRRRRLGSVNPFKRALGDLATQQAIARIRV